MCEKKKTLGNVRGRDAGLRGERCSERRNAEAGARAAAEGDARVGGCRPAELDPCVAAELHMGARTAM